MVFPRKNWTFRQIDCFRPRRDLRSFLGPFWPLRTACGSLLAPEWVSLGAPGPPEFALETSPGRAGTPPGAFLDAQSRCWSVFGHPKRSQGSWKAHFGGSDDGCLVFFYSFKHQLRHYFGRCSAHHCGQIWVPPIIKKYKSRRMKKHSFRIPAHCRYTTQKNYCIKSCAQLKLNPTNLHTT